jgi:hypothetical protein
LQELDGIDASPASFHRHCLALVAHKQQQQQQQQYDHEAETSALGSYYDYRSAAEHSTSAIPLQQRMSSVALFGNDASDISADDAADVSPYEEHSSYDQVNSTVRLYTESNIGCILRICQPQMHVSNARCVIDTQRNDSCSKRRFKSTSASSGLQKPYH